MYEIDYKKGCVESGDDRYIKSLFKKALNGEDITIGFLGGSITQDSVTTKHEYCYAYRVYNWFVNSFPMVKVKYVNAGIGATDSEFAAARLKEQLLAYEPDFILMEHAVNDECSEHYKETYEGVVRQILKHNPSQALLLMCNVFYNDGSSAELMHRRIARHYNLPVVSMRPTIYDALLSGKFDNRVMTADDLHPNDLGHGFVAEVITTYLESILSGIAGQDYIEPEKRIIPNALTQNRYECVIKYDNRNIKYTNGNALPENLAGPLYQDGSVEKPTAFVAKGEPSIHFPELGAVDKYPVLISEEGFAADKTKQKYVRECFTHGFVATQCGSYMEYEVEGSCIAVLFKRTIKLPAPIAKCVIDQNESDVTILDANFDETWGDKLVLTNVYQSEKSAKHIVRIEIIEAHPDDLGDFYFAGIVVSR